MSMPTLPRNFISTRAPREGSDPGGGTRRESGQISTRAPREGSDSDIKMCIRDSVYNGLEFVEK